MEINVTQFVNHEEPTNYSNSIANSGLTNIGQITWNNAKESSQTFVTEENKQEFVNYFKEFGAWDDLDTWPINELNALFIQELSAQLTEMNSFDTYEEYEASDQVSHNIYKGDDDETYFYVGH